MTTNESATLGVLLRRYRLAAALSQETLAERAGLSVAAIAALERGRRTAPRLDTVTLLATALGLNADERAALLAAATGQAPEHANSPQVPTPTAPLPAAPPVPALPPLPVAPTALIGREREQAAVTRLLEGGATLLTLTGPGGVGKTRLALAVATAWRDAVADGAVFVDLSALRDHTLVAATVAHTLGLREAGTQSARELLLAHLSTKELLLVLDNVEQVVEAAPQVAEMVAASPRLRVLVTSRTALRVRAEQQYRVPPLTVPAAERAGRPPTMEDVAGSAAVRLFVARARAILPDFQLDEADAEAVAAICRRLDGLPLAIELAAARTILLSPRALLSRLERRLGVLTGGARDLPARQQTLRATIDWSYELLTLQEQTLLRRLAVFAGGCAPDAAESVCQIVDAAETSTEGNTSATLASASVGDILEGLASLMDKSLLRPEDDAGREQRVAMLETIREYALERLAAGGEAEALRRRHAAYYLSLAEEAEPALTGPEQGAWLARLEREHDNLRAALRWARESGEVARGVRLAAALWRFWYVRGHLTEGREWLETFLNTAVGAGDDSPGALIIRAKALTGAGVLANVQGDYERAAALCEDSLTLYRMLGDKRGMAVALNILGNVAVNQGDYERAIALSEESLTLQRDLGDKRGMAVALNNLGVIVLQQGDYERAAVLCEESVALNRQLGDKRGISAALHNLGDVAREQGDDRQASVLYAESLTLYREMGDNEGIAGCLEAMAGVAYAQGQLESATHLYAAAATLREAIGAPRPSTGHATHDRAMGNVRMALGEQAFAVAWAAGAALPLEQAIDEAVVRVL